MSQLPSLTKDELKSLASRFSFDVVSLARAPVPEGTVHAINPTAKHLRGYLYHLLGDTVSVADLDGDGLPNDLCYSDIRAKALMIAPAPGTGDRYPAFAFDFGALVDVSGSYPLRCNAGDVNEDGLVDLFVGFAGRAPLLLIQKDIGADRATALNSASFVARDLIPNGINERWYSATSNFTDVDGDGHADLIVGNYFADGQELFVADSKKPVELNDTFARANNGGRRRIFLWTGAQGGVSPSVTYRRLDDAFPEETANGWTFAIGAADLDRDGLSDLYIANDFGPDLLLLNRSTPGNVRLVKLVGEEGFATPRSFILGKDTFKGMAIDFADINHDGMFDMAVSNISNDYVLGESHFLWVSTGEHAKVEQGIAPYTNEATKLGTWHSSWGWDIRLDDFDNDGEVELVQGTGLMKGEDQNTFVVRGGWARLQQFAILNDRLVKDPASWSKIDFGAELDGHEPNPFFVKSDDGHYYDISEELFPGLTPNTRGIATADIEGDGDLDIIYANAWEDSQLLVNKAPDPGAYLGLHLLLPIGEGSAGVRIGHPKYREGTPAYGALVEFVHPDGRKMSRQVDGGNGHSGSRSPELMFGLGKIAKDTELSVRVTWRDRKGAVQRSNLKLQPGWHTVTLAASVAQ